MICLIVDAPYGWICCVRLCASGLTRGIVCRERQTWGRWHRERRERRGRGQRPDPPVRSVPQPLRRRLRLIFPGSLRRLFRRRTPRSSCTCIRRISQAHVDGRPDGLPIGTGEPLIVVILRFDWNGCVDCAGPVARLRVVLAQTPRDVAGCKCTPCRAHGG